MVYMPMLFHEEDASENEELTIRMGLLLIYY